MRISRLVSCILSLSLVVILLFGAVSATYASSVAYDYSRPGSEYNKTLTGADILRYYLGEELSTVESDYLISHGGVKIEYDDAITTAYLTAHCEGDSVVIRARSYSYTSASGATVSWTPESAELLGTRLPLVHTAGTDIYEATFFAEDAEQLVAAVSVSFSLSFEVSREDINSLINRAYLDAPRLREEAQLGEALYNELYAEYLIKAEKYESYLSSLSEYEAKLALYEEYLAAYNAYREAADKYGEYLSELELYEAALSAYEKYISDTEKYDAEYLLYARYLNELRTYEGKMAEYEEYTSLAAAYRSHLSIIDFAKKSMTPLSRTLYSAIFGTTVDLVLRERDTIESELGGGVPAAVVDLAGDSTERLRELMRGYFALEGEEARYYYYASYYEDFKKGFCDLLSSLDYLYSNRRVRGILIAYDRDEQYRILLAQLFVISNALTDGAVKSLDPSYLAGSSQAGEYRQFVFDSTYRIDTVYKYTVDEVLYGEEYLADTNSARPFTDTFPSPKEEPTAPEAVEEPTKPTYVPKPVLPEAVPAPGEAPDEVENPGNPPTRVENPGNPPTPYKISPEVSALISAYVGGELSYRDAVANEGLTYTVTKTVEKKIGLSVDEITVSFYDTDRLTHLFSTTVDRGTAVSYGVDYVPEKAADGRASYEFVGWEDEDGVAVQLSTLDRDAVLYPRFKEILKEYEVVWSIDGNLYTDTLLYGEMPVCSYATEKASDGLYFYTFSGFDKELLPVTESVEYIAEFGREYIVPTSEGGGAVSFGSDGYTVNLLSSYDTEYRIDRILEKSAGLYAVTLNTRYATLTLTPGTVTTLRAEGIARLSIAVSSTAKGTYTYLVTTKNSSGECVSSAARIGVLIPCRLEYNDRLGLYYTADGTENKARFTLSDSRLSAELLPDRPYELRYDYKLTLVANDLISPTLSKSVYSYGESIGLSLDIPVGIRITSLLLRLEDGEEREVELGSITMPMCDATLVIVAEYLEYKIVFSGDDAPISTQYVRHGELPTAPESPPKASDGEYTYEFVGWSAEISPASRDTVYFAVYSRTPIEKADTGGRITVFMLLNLGISLAFCLVFIFIPALIMNVKVIRRFKSGVVKKAEKTE